MPLRWRLIVLALSAALPVLVFAIGYQYVHYQEQIKEGGARVLSGAHSLVLRLDQELQSRISVLQSLCDSQSLQTGDLDVFRRRAEQTINRQFPGSHLKAIRPNGQLLLNTGKGDVLPIRADSGSVHQAFATGRPTVSAVSESRTGGSTIAIDVPAQIAGHPAVISMLTPPALLTDLILSQNFPGSWYVGIVDREGVVVARVPDGQKYIGLKASENFFRAASGDAGVAEITSREGVPLLLAYDRSGGFGWTVVLGIPRREIVEPVRAAAFGALGVGGLTLAAALGLALFIARSISGPIETLHRMARISDDQALPPVEPSGLAEVDDVAYAMLAAERERRRSHATELLLRNGIESIPEGFAIYDAEDRLVICNDAYRRLFPGDPAQVVPGARFEEVLRAGLQGRHRPACAADEARWVAERVRDHLTPDLSLEEELGDGRWVLVTNSRLPSGGLAGLRIDISKLKAAQLALKRSEERLVQSQKLDAIGTMSGGLAHDFNNLLGIMIANLELARDQARDDAELREMIVEALEAGWHGADLTRRLLAFARRQPLRPTRLDVNELVSDTARLLRRLLREDIEVSLRLAGDIWPVTVDPAQLEASLANLATNARDAMPRGGNLLITTGNRHLDAGYVAIHPEADEGDFVMIEVSDTGIGIAPDMLNHIFEPFYTTKEAGKGTGLGLSMMFGFLQQSGGHVSVYSEPGAGTTFRLYLPRSGGEAEPEPQPSSVTAEAGAGEVVLVVEDNPRLRRVVIRQLRELGYRVLEAEGAAAALELLHRERVDLLFTDIVMPGGLDGLALARTALDRSPALKVVLTSGFPPDRVAAATHRLHGIQLLSKPASKEELAAALRNALTG
jgi:signal transduction histidine kinase